MAPEPGAFGVEVDENGGVGFGSETPDEIADIGDDLDIGSLSEEEALELFAGAPGTGSDLEGLGGYSETDDGDDPFGFEPAMGGIEGGVETAEAETDGEGGLGGDAEAQGPLVADSDLDSGGISG